MIKKYLAPTIIIAVAVAFFFPQQGIALQNIIPYGLMILLYSGCLNFDIHEMKNLKSQKLLLVITFFLLYFLGGFSLLLFQHLFSKVLIAGFLIILTVPCGMATIYFTNVFDGNLSISLVVTVISNLLAPISIPIFYTFFASQIYNINEFNNLKLNFLSVFLMIAKIVFIPFVLAMITRHFNWHEKAKVVSNLGLPIMFLMTFGLVAPGVATMIENIKLTVMIFAIVTFLVTLQFLIGFYLQKSHNIKVSLSIILSYKNFTIASLISLKFFPIEAALPSLIFTVVNNLSLTIMPIIFKNINKPH